MNLIHEILIKVSPKFWHVWIWEFGSYSPLTFIFPFSSLFMQDTYIKKFCVVGHIRLMLTLSMFTFIQSIMWCQIFKESESISCTKISA